MTKMKTKKSLRKRFRVTKNGKVMRMQGFRRHLNEKKSANRKRSLRRVLVTRKTHAKKIKKAMGR
jgi:large subunit ribosomal protein L35